MTTKKRKRKPAPIRDVQEVIKVAMGRHHDSKKVAKLLKKWEGRELRPKMPELQIKELGFSERVNDRHFVGRIKLFQSKSMKPLFFLSEMVTTKDPELQGIKTLAGKTLALGNGKDKVDAILKLAHAWEKIKW